MKFGVENTKVMRYGNEQIKIKKKFFEIKDFIVCSKEEKNFFSRFPAENAIL